MSCDFNRDELRVALIKSTVLLRAAALNSESGNIAALYTRQAEENKRVLKEEAANRPRLANPETCPIPEVK